MEKRRRGRGKERKRERGGTREEGREGGREGGREREQKGEGWRVRESFTFFMTQGLKGLPGTRGLPGTPGSKVSLIINFKAFSSMLSLDQLLPNLKHL